MKTTRTPIRILLLSCAVVLSSFARGALLTEPTTEPLLPKLTAAGSMDISTAAGHALKNCRPYLASKIVGSDAWKEEFSTYRVVSKNNGVLVLEAAFEKAKATVTIHRDTAGRLQFSGKLDATSSDALELARFHYLDGLLPTPETNLLSMRHYELPGRIIKPTEEVQAPLKSNWACEPPKRNRRFFSPSCSTPSAWIRGNRACSKPPPFPMATTNKNSATGSAFVVMPSALPESGHRWSAIARGINSAKACNPSTSAVPWTVLQVFSHRPSPARGIPAHRAAPQPMKRANTTPVRRSMTVAAKEMAKKLSEK